MTLPHLTLSDLETSKSGSLNFRKLISRKGAELGHCYKTLIGDYKWGVQLHYHI